MNDEPSGDEQANLEFPAGLLISALEDADQVEIVLRGAGDRSHLRQCHVIRADRDAVLVRTDRDVLLVPMQGIAYIRLSWEPGRQPRWGAV